MSDARKSAAPAADGGDATLVCSDRFACALILDDDAPLRRALARIVRSWRTHVLEAATLADARRLLLQHSPQLVICDVRLPDGSGAVLAETARQLSPAPLVVAMSGVASASEAFVLAQSGVRVYLTKPFAPAELVQAIADLLSAQGPAGPFGHPDHAQPLPADALAEKLELFAQRYGITQREMELVRLAMAGVPRARCPALLEVSENTCKTMSRRILQRCGARSLADVARLVLVSPDEG